MAQQSPTSPRMVKRMVGDMGATTLAIRLAWLYLAILALLPFHAFFTTWAGSNTGHLDIWRIWKELILFATFPFAGWLASRQPQYRQWLKTAWLPRLIAVYLVLQVLLGIWAVLSGRVNGSALIYGLLADLRYLGFFLLVLAVTTWTDLLQRHATTVLLGAGVVVVVFGILQITVLPYDFLKHFGYGPDTIPAYQTVDNKLAYYRIQSTLRGPNPLGAYLVLLGTVILVLWRKRLPRMSWRLMCFGAAVALALLFSYSRSAYLGLLISALIVLVLAARPRHRRYMSLGAVILVTLGGLMLLALRHNSEAQNTFFHSDNTSRSAQSSNAARAAALKTGLHDVLREPLGRGPGTAGPASSRNNHPARIAENYFLQIGQEVGWLGLALFTAITTLIGKMLWLRRSDPLSLALLASLVGLTWVNFVSHAWADDTLGLLWWGLAAVAVTPAILKTQHKHLHG